MKKIIDFFPELYKPFLPAGFHKTILDETNASCGNCAMVKKDGDTVDPHSTKIENFLPTTKCCTYYPKIMNYLVGGVLADTSEAGKPAKQVALDIISKKIGVTPGAIIGSRKHALLYDKSAEFSFGRNQTIVCPFFEKDSGNCLKWQYRSAMCSTWFCKFKKGKEGEIFWANVNEYLTYTEAVLSRYALTQLKWDVSKIEMPITISFAEHDRPNTISLRPGDMDDYMSNAEYGSLWGKWEGREDEFYIASHEVIKKLSRRQFMKISGHLQEILLGKTLYARDRMQNLKLPEKLLKNPHLIIRKLSTGNYQVTTFNGYNMFELTSRLFSILEEFDGASDTKGVLKNVMEKFDCTIEKEFLKSLFHFRILIAA